MGPRLGIFYYGTESYPSGKYDRNLDGGFYPSQPWLNYEEWQNIIDDYTATSPDTIIVSGNSKSPIKNSLSLFFAIIPKFSYSTPATAVVKIDESQREHQLVISDVPKQTVYRLNKNLEKVDSIRTHGPVVDIEIPGKEWLACNVGVLNPNNGKFGKAEYIQIKKDGKLNNSTAALFDGLVRPVQIVSADLNKDGREDYILCEFGYYQGSLPWMENLGKSQFKKHLLRPLPGAIKVYKQDYYQNRLPDIWALFSQGEEGIFLFTNKGNGQFVQKEVLRFPPVYGSSYLNYVILTKTVILI